MDEKNSESVDWREFLTDFPPGRKATVVNALECSHELKPYIPELRLFCKKCDDNKSYCLGAARAQGHLFAAEAERKDIVLTYSCRKCNKEVKSYAIRFSLRMPNRAFFGDVEKMGEWPRFLPRTPSKLLSLVGPDRDFFLKGRMAESEGMGIGAFGYYRRVVENQKNRLLDEIIRVARHIGISQENLVLLEDARNETQFTKSVDSVRDAIPAVLLIKGHNPLTLLHKALSRGLHEESEEHCLQLAHDVRLILVELAERLTQAMRDEKDLNEAIKRLVNPS